MRDLAVLAFVTLDGVMQAPGSVDEDRSAGFAHGGWATPYWDGVMDHVLRTAMADPYDIVLGRRTYDLFANHWPQVSGSKAAERLNGSAKYVMTSSPIATEWQHTQILTGKLFDEINALKAQDGPLLQVHGSAMLVRSLMGHGLVDELRLWTFPVLVGAGKRLFEGNSTHQPVHLLAAETLDNGVSSHVYRLAA
ncbi:dihydrofolate reductase family protein [Tateyamaria omphalii]|uniref:dihydrofolate reductase family protein n=1 Tax=Tateyamaria omphalii TaxID=299262 RepID=UPI001C990385|nr:dihydrofolate reductase family protein [Tateyamaria omphalii]MBY5935387.1 dihydrofolate reductase family protein [Tateyamaria omphalii]